MKIANWKNLNANDRLLFANRFQMLKKDVIIEKNVAGIIEQVKRQGDKALQKFTELFDKVVLDSLIVDEEAFNEDNAVAESYQQAITVAWNNINNFHKLQRPNRIAMENKGITLSREPRAIKRVGLYIPGGSAPLISTILMLAIPAKIAGCEEIIVVTPPKKNGSINPLILWTAKQCGIEKIYKVGGAQAIAALAYGTETIPKVDKIFGPGNKYVTEAKVQVSNDRLGAAIDMPAGPSEVMVIADDTANAKFVASDLIAQAEHDEDARSVLLTTSRALGLAVIDEIECQKAALSRKEIIDRSLQNGIVLIIETLEDCFNIANDYAPEHLILQIENPEQYKEKINNAGSVFMGPWTPEALGDYASGSTHVLPTYGYGKTYSGIGVEDFMKNIMFQSATKEGLNNLKSVVAALADIEGLDGHKNSVLIRG